MLIAVSNHILVNIFQLHSPLELIALEVPHHNLIVAGIYLPPNIDHHHVHELFRILGNLPSGQNIVILGDINMPDINWLTMTATTTLGTLFCELSFNLNLIQVISKPTHIHGNTLDIVLSNNPNDITNILVDNSTTTYTKSDHYLITFKYITASHHTFHKPTPSTKIPLFSKADPVKVYEFISAHIGSITTSPDANVNTLCNNLRDLMFMVCNSTVPHISISKSHQPKWFNAQIRHLLNKVHTLRRVAKKHPSTANSTKLAKQESSLQSLMESTKRQYVLNYIKTHHSNPRKIFNHLRQLSNDSQIPQALHHEQTLYSSPSGIANAFNVYFNSIFTRSQFILPPCDKLPTPSLQLNNISISSDDVYLALSKLKVNKAPGCDNVSPHLVHLCSCSLLPVITSLFLKCLMTASLPQEWKTHKIVPIHKSGDKTLISNYRPISLLCITSKVLESIIYNKIIAFVRPKISKHQFGFLRNRSCTTQLLSSYADIFNLIEKRSTADAIFLDFRKAFDSVPHPELLYKLWQIGITGDLWQFFRCYLSNRHHYVEINKVPSSELPVISGVPQGSILGPLLFLIYINDLPSCIQYSTPYLFADDSKLIYAISRFNINRLQSDIDSINQWCNTWKLAINPSKCACTTFNLSPSDSANSHYTINNITIPEVTQHLDLGVLVSHKLSWSSHIASICQSAYQSLNFLRRSLQNSACVELRKQLYFALVRSKLSYCSQLWRPHLLADISTIERVQRRASKFILHDYSSNYKDRLIKLNLLPLSYWLELQDILFLIKSIQQPSDNLNIFDYITFVTSPTRLGSSLKLKVNFCRSTTTRHFYFNRVVRLWNGLPHVNPLDPYTQLKHKLNVFFWNHFVLHFNPDHPCTYHFVCPCSSCHIR